MAHASTAARPKRAAEDFSQAQEASNKKPRFDARNPSTLAADAPEEDIILNADVIGKSGLQTKRLAVKLDGYESDSDNDNFNARAAERERAARNKTDNVSKDEEDDDMFAEAEETVQGTVDGDDDEELAREGKKVKKDVRFLDQTEIDGQVLHSKSGGHVSSNILLGQNSKKRASSVSSSSSSGDDEDRAALPEEVDEDTALELGAGGKKKHAPRLEAFNLKEEDQEGRFDQSGNFIRNAADPEAFNDRWLEGLSKKDMKAAREAQTKREESRKLKDQEDDALLTSDLLSTLIQHLEVGETTLEALQRLNKGRATKERKLPKWKQKKQGKMDIDEQPDGSLDPAEDARKKTVEAITGAVDALYSRGHNDIYDTEREMLMRLYKRDTGDDWTASTAKVALDGSPVWQFRWTNGDGQLHGPYDLDTMKAWQEAGYFEEGAEFKKTTDSEWSRVLRLAP